MHTHKFFEFPGFLLRGFGVFEFPKFFKIWTENFKLNLFFLATSSEIFFIPGMDKGIPKWYNL